jgi:hypothetical protein
MNLCFQTWQVTNFPTEFSTGMPPIFFSNSNWLAFVGQGGTVFLNIMYMNFKLQRVNELYTHNVNNITVGQLVILLSRATSPPFIVDAQVRS